MKDSFNLTNSEKAKNVRLQRCPEEYRVDLAHLGIVSVHVTRPDDHDGISNKQILGSVQRFAVSDVHRQFHSRDDSISSAVSVLTLQTEHPY